MKTRIVFLLLSAIVLASCTVKDKPSLAPIKEVKDTYYGRDIIDQYRYMENMDDTIFLNWMKEYSDYSRKILDNIPGRSSIIDQVVEFDSRKSERIAWLTISEKGRYFYLKMTPEDEIPKLYYRNDYGAEEVLLYDPDNYSDDEDVNYVISGITPDFNGDRVAVALAANGSETSILLVVDVNSGKVLSDLLSPVFGYVTWLKGGKEFLYGKPHSTNVHDPSRLLDTKVYYHRLGDDQSRDKVIFSADMYKELEIRKEEIPSIIFDPYEDNFFLMLETVERYVRLFHSKIQKFEPSLMINWKPLIRKEDQVQQFYPMGDDIYLYTAKNAPGFEILRTSITSPSINDAEVIVPENEKGIISGFAFTKSALYYKIKINGVEEVLYKLPSVAKEATEIQLPVKAGSLSIITRGHKYDDIWIEMYGWTMDGQRYRYSEAGGSFTPEPLSTKAEFSEFADVEVEEIMVPSHDGVMVPLSIIYKKGTPMDGSAPLLMSGYGAYGIPRKPYFSPEMLVWTLKGGILAVAHVRGGGELGDSWRLAGHKTTKPNTWKDFIACAEYLQNNKYTSAKHMAAYAGSAGGILIGRAMTERPDLFAAAIPLVGVLNPLRIEQSPNGPVNAPEFGTVKDSVECMALIEMDPYLKIKDNADYPATLITAGFNDPRVIVWQPAKFAARLQAANGSKNPILFDVNYTSGHGVGDTKSKSFEDYADVFAFALWQTGHPEFQKK